jgi:hypothetical protein
MVAAAVLLGGLLATWFGRIWRRVVFKRRQRSGRAAEGAAARVLRKNGYTVLEEQVEATGALWVDGVQRQYTVRADYLVSRGGRLFVAEVKSGRVAPRLDHAPTRRQLLEYALSFPVDGVVLVDMGAREIHHVRWVETPARTEWSLWVHRGRWSRWTRWIWVGLVLVAGGVALGIYIAMGTG